MPCSRANGRCCVRREASAPRDQLSSPITLSRVDGESSGGDLSGCQSAPSVRPNNTMRTSKIGLVPLAVAQNVATLSGISRSRREGSIRCQPRYRPPILAGAHFEKLNTQETKRSSRLDCVCSPRPNDEIQGLQSLGRSNAVQPTVGRSAPPKKSGRKFATAVRQCFVF